MSRLYRLILVGLSVMAVFSSTALAAAPRQLAVPPTNPYWTLLTAQSHKALRFGARVGTCTFLPSASCAAVQLPGEDLSGAFVQFGNFVAADLAGSSLAGATTTHTSFQGADLDGVSLVGTAPVHADSPALTCRT